MRLSRGAFALVLFFPSVLYATIFGTVRGVVTDARQQAVANARVLLSSRTSGWQQSTRADEAGAFAFPAVPIGVYTLHAERNAIAVDQVVRVASAGVVTAPLTLPAATASAAVDVTASPVQIDAHSPTTESTVGRVEVQRTPGTDRSNSLSIITDFVPGAYVVHDQLHVRGGLLHTGLPRTIPQPVHGARRRRSNRVDRRGPRGGGQAQRSAGQRSG